MVITMNGSEIDFSLEGEKDLGGLLSSLDSWLEERGFVIRSLSVDGEDRSSDLSPVKDVPVSSVERVDLVVEPLSGYRAAALERASEWAERVSSALSAGQSRDAAETERISSEGRELLEGRSGFLEPDELSLLEWNLVALGKDPGTEEERKASAARAGQVASALSSRARDLRDPFGAARRAGEDYASLRPRLLDLPVLLQTGRDREAVSVLSDFSDFFARSVRLIPVLSGAGMALGAEDLGGKDPAEFYASLNRVLTEFLDAFSSQDTVLVGDLSEYEIIPQLDALFKGIASRAKAEDAT